MTSSLRLGLANAPAVNLKIEVPAKKYLLVNGQKTDSFDQNKKEITEKKRTFTIPVGGSKEVQIKLTDRQTGPESETLLFSKTQYGLFVRPGEVTWNAKSQLHVYGRAINIVRFSVPSDLEITDVKSVGLESWKLKANSDDEDWKQIKLQYRQSFEQQKEVLLQGVMKTEPEESWDAPILKVRKAASQNGTHVDSNSARGAIAIDGSNRCTPCCRNTFTHPVSEEFKLSARH